jgi:hypothetical protein
VSSVEEQDYLKNSIPTFCMLIDTARDKGQLLGEMGLLTGEHLNVDAVFMQ